MAKILMFSHSPIPDIRIDKEVKALVNAGHEIYAICSGKGKGEIPEYYKEVFFIPLKRTQKAFVPFSYSKPKKEYKKIIEKIKPDVLHAHDIVAANIAIRVKPKDAKFIYEDHEIWELIKKLELTERKGIIKFPLRVYQYLMAKFLSKKIMKKSDIVVVVQKYWIDFYVDRGIKRKKIISIENFPSKDLIDEAIKRVDLVDDFILSDPRKKIVHSSKLSKVSDDFLRDITKFVEAVNELDDWVLVIFGSEDKIFTDLGVKFLPPRSPVEYLASSAKCDVALNPLVLNERLNFCSPNRLYESVALGLRVISTKAIAFYENFGDMLIWIGTDTPKEKIVEILKNIDDYPTGEEIKIFSKKFNWEDSVKKLVNRYEEILKHP